MRDWLGITEDMTNLAPKDTHCGLHTVSEEGGRWIWLLEALGGCPAWKEQKWYVTGV